MVVSGLSTSLRGRGREREDTRAEHDGRVEADLLGRDDDVRVEGAEGS